MLSVEEKILRSRGKNFLKFGEIAQVSKEKNQIKSNKKNIYSTKNCHFPLLQIQFIKKFRTNMI
jgi:hypothetical protein